MLLSKFAKLGVVEETTAETFEPAGTFLAYPWTDADLTPGGTTETSEARTGRGTQNPALNATRWRDFTGTGELCWLLWNPWFQWFLRSGAFGTEISHTGSSDVNVVASATHYDGTTGWAITAPTGDLADFIAEANNCEGAMLRCSAFSNAANNHKRRIKWAWNTGSVDQLDIWDTYYTANPTAGAYGCVMIAETLASAVLKVGAAIRDQASTAAEAARRISIVGSLEDATTGLYKNGYGNCVDKLRVYFDGAGRVMIEVGASGFGSDATTQSFPGSGSFSNAAGYANSTSYILANATGMTGMYVGGWHQVGATNLSSFNLDLSGNTDSAAISGRSTRGDNAPGSISGTCNLSTYNDETLTTYLDGLCEALSGSNQVPIDLTLSTTLGDYEIGVLNACFPVESGHSMAGSGRSSGTFAPTISEWTTTSRQVIVQKFTA